MGDPSGAPTIVDVFVGPDALGNPAGVVLDDLGVDDDQMALAAAEVGLSETAFVHPGPDGLGLRWFTPTCEVDLCGHASMAAVAVLWASGRLREDTVTFTTRSGPIRARCSGSRASVDLPRRQADETSMPPWALGLGGRSALAAPGALMIEVDQPDDVRSFVAPLEEIAREPVDLVIVWALGGIGAEVTLRVFGPRIGLDEDPATGSAQCALAPAVASRIGSSHFRAHQCSARGGRMEVDVHEHTVELSGATVIRGGSEDHGG
jgi:predicted PhzF superfamily epimerase YddE/YHI9